MNTEDGEVQEKIEGLTSEQEADLNQLQPDYVPPVDGGSKEKKPDLKTVDLVQGLLTGVFGVLAGRLGDHWALTEDEAKSIAVPATQVIDKYIPDFDSGPELALVMATAVVVLPRVMKSKAIEHEGEQESEVGKDGSKSEHVTA